MGLDHVETRRRYDETIDVYDSRYSAIQRTKYPILLDMLSPLPGGRILDWGCGTGLAYDSLDQFGARYFGLDFSLAMLSIHRKRCHAAIVLGDCIRLPFKSKSFDGILGSTVLQNLVRGREAMLEISRVLKDNCRAVLSFPRKASVSLMGVSEAGLSIVGRMKCDEDIAIALSRVPR